MISAREVEEIAKNRMKFVAEKGVHIFGSIAHDDWDIVDDEWEKSLPLKVTPFDVFGNDINFKNNESRAYLPAPNQVPLCLLIPLYDKIIFELPNWNPMEIKKYTGFSIDELSILMEENRLGILIHSDMSIYKKQVINKIISKPNSICLSLDLWTDIFFRGVKPVNDAAIKIPDKELKRLFTTVIEKVKHWGLDEDWANEYYAKGEEFVSFLKPIAKEVNCKMDKKKCTPCIIGHSLQEYLDRLRAISLKSVLQYSHSSASIFSHFESVPVGSECKIDILPTNFIEMMLKEFNLIYTPDIPLDRYLDIVDSSTGKSLKNFVKKAYVGGAFNPNKFIDDLRFLKRDILDLARKRNRRISVFSSTSDIVETTVEKIHNKTIIGGSDQSKSDISEWLFQKTKPLIGKVLGKTPDIIQIHHTIKRLNKVRIEKI